MPERAAAARVQLLMSKLGYRLTMALAAGRRSDSRVRTREAVLCALLAKRAAAHRAGLAGQERMLRNQILWALPMHRVEEPGRAA